MTVAELLDGNGYSTYSGGGGGLSDSSFDLDGETYTIKSIVAWEWMYISLQKELPEGLTLEVDGVRFPLTDAWFLTYSYALEYRWLEADTSWSRGDTVRLALNRAVRPGPVKVPETGKDVD